MSTINYVKGDATAPSGNGPMAHLLWPRMGLGISKKKRTPGKLPFFVVCLAVYASRYLRHSQPKRNPAERKSWLNNPAPAFVPVTL